MAKGGGVPEYLAPGVYVEEVGFRPKPIEGVPTSVAAFIGKTGRGPKRPTSVTSQADYARRFGPGGPWLPGAIAGFFDNGGRQAFVCRLTPRHGLADRLAALAREACRNVALVAAPGLTDDATAAALIAHCEANRRFAVLDAPRGDPRALDPRGAHPSRNAAFYAPWLEVAGGFVPPSGHVLGIYARTDAQSGVWKAPANEIVRGATGLEHALGAPEQEQLNARGVNLIRAFPGRGIRVWGARTLSDDGEWKYVSVRRLFLYLERSIDRGTQWVVFEPNAEPLWARVRGEIENFLFKAWRDGALQGDRPQRAYYVRCDRGTMTQADLDAGRLVVEIGIAPVKPAEFVIIRIGQWTSDAS